MIIINEDALIQSFLYDGGWNFAINLITFFNSDDVYSLLEMPFFAVITATNEFIESNLASFSSGQRFREQKNRKFDLLNVNISR